MAHEMAVSQVLFLSCCFGRLTLHFRCSHLTQESLWTPAILRFLFPPDDAPTKFGLLVRGVYPFHQLPFGRCTVSVALSGYSSHSTCALGCFSAVNSASAKLPCLAAGTITTTISDRTSLDFPHQPHKVGATTHHFMFLLLCRLAYKT
jgi:hypothetical protein